MKNHFLSRFPNHCPCRYRIHYRNRVPDRFRIRFLHPSTRMARASKQLECRFDLLCSNLPLLNNTDFRDQRTRGRLAHPHPDKSLRYCKRESGIREEGQNK